MLNPFIDYLARKKAIVNLKTNVSFRGIIWYTTARYIIMRNAEFLGDNPKNLDGEVVVERKEVQFIQVI